MYQKAFDNLAQQLLRSMHSMQATGWPSHFYAFVCLELFVVVQIPNTVVQVLEGER
jgi:hypothetical protein